MGLLDAFMKYFAYGQEDDETQQNPTQLQNAVTNQAPVAKPPVQTQLPTQFNQGATPQVKKSGVQSIIEQNMATDPEPFIPDEQPVTEGGEKKNTFTKTLLPLLFRFGLPAVAGGVLGSKHPMGAAGGALTGLAHGGFGYLKDQGAQANRDLKEKQLADKNAYNMSKLSLDQNKADALGDYRNRMASVAEQNASTSAASKLGKEDKILQFLSNQFGGQPVSESDVETFAASLATQMKPGELEITEEGFFGGEEVVPDETLIQQWMDAYNRYLKRGGTKSTRPSGSSGSSYTTSSGLSYTLE